MKEIRVTVKDKSKFDHWVNSLKAGYVIEATAGFYDRPLFLGQPVRFFTTHRFIYKGKICFDIKHNRIINAN